MKCMTIVFWCCLAEFYIEMAKEIHYMCASHVCFCFDKVVNKHISYLNYMVCSNIM